MQALHDRTTEHFRDTRGSYPRVGEPGPAAVRLLCSAGSCELGRCSASRSLGASMGSTRKQGCGRGRHAVASVLVVSPANAATTKRWRRAKIAS
jgi:hypothetical protein